MPKKNSNSLETILARAKPQGGCLVWQGAKRDNGYGVVSYNNKQRSVHAVVWELTSGSALGDLEIDHSCNNRACVLFAHLSPVTHAKNMELARLRRATCRNGHPKTSENIYTAEVPYKGGTRMQSYCRPCRAQHAQDFRDRKAGK